MRKVRVVMIFAITLVQFGFGQWQKLSFPRGNPCTLLSTPQGLLASNHNSIYLSMDDALTWDSLSSVKTGTTRLIQVGEILLSTSSYGRGLGDIQPLACTFRSHDFGRSWDSVLAGVYGASSIISYSSKLYTNLDGHLFSSPDTGRTWARLDTPNTFPDFITQVIAGGGTLYLRIQADRLYRSNDGGQTWDSVHTGFPSAFYNVIAINSSVYVGTFQWGFFVSHDQGNTWKATNSGLPDSSGCSNLFLFENSLIASVSKNFFQTVNRLNLSDTTWTKIDSGLSLGGNVTINDFAYNEKYIFLAADSSVWRRPLSDFTTNTRTAPRQIVAHDFALRAFPNPFNPTTAIRYELATSGYVALKVYDALGREIRTLVSRYELAGKYTVDFDGARLPSGIYFCRLTANGNTAVKKMVLVR